MEVVDVYLGTRISSVLTLAAVLVGGLALAGCEDNVEIIRDPEVKISRGMTWAWRPVGTPETVNRDADGRPIKSRDVIATPTPAQQRLESNRDWNTVANRNKLKGAIGHALSEKGLRQVTDPGAADFLVDYHVAVRTQNATVGRVYPGYPGLVCGPYGCWSGWGWGPPEVEYQNVRFHEGTFVLDIASRDPKRLAYRAISQRELNHRVISSSLAESAVNHLLKGLKPR